MPEDTHEDIRRRLFDAAWDVPAFPPAAARTVARARRRAATTIGAAAIAVVAAISVVVSALPKDAIDRTGGPRSTNELVDREFLLDVESGSTTEIRGLPSDAWLFERSPIGDRLAFAGKARGIDQIWTANLDGSDPERMTHDPLGATDPAWSPDGREIVYVGFGRGRTRGLFIVDVATKATRLLYRGEKDPWNPAWSPNGESILFHVSIKGPRIEGADSGTTVIGATSFRLQLVDVASGRTRVVAGNAKNAAYDGSWLPDGSVVFIRAAGIELQGPDGGFALWTVRPDGTSRRQLVPVPSDHWAWATSVSPDGSRIAFASTVDSNDEMFVYDLIDDTLKSVGLGWSPIWVDDQTLFIQRTMAS